DAAPRADRPPSARSGRARAPARPAARRSARRARGDRRRGARPSAAGIRAADASGASGCRVDHDVTALAVPVGLRAQALALGDVVDDLALERVHRTQRHRRAGLLRLGDRGRRELLEARPVLGPEAADIEHQAGALTGAGLDRQARRLLQGVPQLALGPVETGELVGAADLDGGPVAVHVDVHVAVEVGDVQQLLEVVGGDVALLLEATQTLLGG